MVYKRESSSSSACNFTLVSGIRNHNSAQFKHSAINILVFNNPYMYVCMCAYTCVCTQCDNASSCARLASLQCSPVVLHFSATYWILCTCVGSNQRHQHTYNRYGSMCNISLPPMFPIPRLNSIQLFTSRSTDLFTVHSQYYTCTVWSFRLLIRSTSNIN